MGVLIELDENPDWDTNPLRLEGWEPWQEEECEEVHELGGCEYCGTTEQLRENPEPFGGRVCCESCFLTIISDDDSRDRVSHEPWRCRRVN